MSHFSTALGQSLAVEVKVRTRKTERRLESGGAPLPFAVAEQVDHHDGGRTQFRRAKWPTHHGSDVILELRADRSFDGLVPGIVHARGQLIDQHLPVCQQKHLHTKATNATHGRDRLPCH